MAEARGIEISDVQIENAVVALKKVQEHWLECETRKAKLLGEDENSDVFLQISLKKIPEIRQMKMVKVFLTHWPQSSREVCLITGDLDKKDLRADYEETVRFYKQLLRKHKVTGITDVISLRELRTEYKQYEARRKLCGAYDTFLADKKIGGCLSRALGKFFMENRKFPQQVDLRAKNLNKEIATALKHTVCFLTGRGSNCVVYVGSITQPDHELRENIMSAIIYLSNVLPGTGKNIQKLHIKCAKSLAVPLYFSLESADVQFPPSSSCKEVIEDELTTLQKRKVKVFPDGNVDVFPLSDSDVSEVDESELDEFEKEILKNEKLAQKISKNKRRRAKKQTRKENKEHVECISKNILKEETPRKRSKKAK